MDPLHRVAPFLPLKATDFEILFALADGRLHGYAIAKRIAEHTGGMVHIEAGNLHRALRKLLSQGLIAESEDRPPEEQDDERRRYWMQTPLGRAVLSAEAARMRSVAAVNPRMSVKTTLATLRSVC